jgi:hypothetical protein
MTDTGTRPPFDHEYIVGDVLRALRSNRRYLHHAGKPSGADTTWDALIETGQEHITAAIYALSQLPHTTTP